MVPVTLQKFEKKTKWVSYFFFFFKKQKQKHINVVAFLNSQNNKLIE